MLVVVLLCDDEKKRRWMVVMLRLSYTDGPFPSLTGCRPCLGPEWTELWTAGRRRRGAATACRTQVGGGAGTAGNAMLWAVSFSDWATDEGQQTVRFWGSRSGEGLELALRWPPFIGQRSRSRSCGGLRAAAERGKKGFAQRGAFFSIGTQDILDMVGLALPHPRAMAGTRCASSGMAVAESGPFSGWGFEQSPMVVERHLVR